MPLHGLQPIRDPGDEIIEVHLAALKWNILQRRFGLVASDLVKLQSSSAELLELLKTNLPGFCPTRQERQQAGILRRHTVFCTKFAKFFCMVGQKTSAPRQ